MSSRRPNLSWAKRCCRFGDLRTCVSCARLPERHGPADCYGPRRLRAVEIDVIRAPAELAYGARATGASRGVLRKAVPFA
jgi:hypothetical protein